MESPPISILVPRNMTSAIATQDTTIALRQGSLGFFGDLSNNVTPDFAGRVFAIVMCPGVAFPARSVSDTLNIPHIYLCVNGIPIRVL